MRIIHSVFSSGFNGSERYCFDLAEAQRALGHDVRILAARGSAIAERADGRVPVTRLGYLGRPATYLYHLIALAPDIVHAHLSAACKSLAMLPRRSKGPATVASLHLGYKPRQHRRLDAVIQL